MLKVVRMDGNEELYPQALRPRGNASAMLVSAPARLSEMNDVLYTAEASVAGSRIRVVVDTGSSDIWLKTSALKPVLQHREAALGYLKRNQEGKILVPEIILKFGMGTVLGVPLSVKEFCVAGSCVKHQGLVLGLKITDILDLASFDGLLGLALPRDSQDPLLGILLRPKGGAPAWGWGCDEAIKKCGYVRFINDG
eukprot:Skav234305  [mRNA]  locus=scaffold1018:257641:259808:+ [translate_table: standard]